ncbi:MAG: hypothetical protein AAF585_28850 [Verrucomicrobiota bacterium]
MALKGTSADMQDEFRKFDDARSKLSNKVFRLVGSGSDLPEIATKVIDNVFSLGVEAADDKELDSLQRKMQSSFPLCGLSFSRLYGPQLVAIISGDDVTDAELITTINRFQQINLCLMELGGRSVIKLFGKTFGRLKNKVAVGSLIIVASDAERVTHVRQLLAALPMRNDTAINQMKQIFSRWQFWLKACVGLIEYKTSQLRQEVVVLDSSTGTATSTASPRWSFEFGFSLSDLAVKGPPPLPIHRQPVGPPPLPQTERLNYANRSA